MADGEIAVQATLHRSPASWVVLPITLSRVHILEMVLDTGSPVSAISPATAAELRSLNLLASPSKPPYHHRLTTLSTAHGHPLPDIDVVVLPRLGRMATLGIEVIGLLGLNFLTEFGHVCYYVDTRRLVLGHRT